MTLLNECNQLSEKEWEVEAELRKAQIRIGATEETVEREHRLEIQARAQVLGITLKAVL